MIEITNLTKGPVQLILRSKRGKELVVQNIPGIGAGKNKFFLEDEQATEYITKLERAGLISQKKVVKKNKGD